MPLIEKQNSPPDLLQSTAPDEEMVWSADYRGMNRFMMLIIAAAMIPWLFGGYQILGFNITGWAWVIPTILALLVCFQNIKYITFPVGLWLPWLGILCVYWYFGRENPNATQSFLQTLSPILVGCAASIFRPNNWQLENIIRWLTHLAFIVWILLFIRLPMMFSGVIPIHTFLAAEMIGLLLLGACYASFYACGRKIYLYYYFSMLAIMFISLTRGPIVAMFSCLPLTPAPMTTGKRFVLCTIVIILALFIFNTDRVQQKMFSSGSGELTDVSFGNPELRTHGRSLSWDILWHGVENKPWFGSGWNYHRVVLMKSGSQSYAPHNDWLKLLYDMGIAGAGIYLIVMILQMFLLKNIAKWSSGAHQMLAYGSATAFIPYALIMLTDNVVLYVQFFGNLHFALIGIIYGSIRHLEDNMYV